MGLCIAYAITFSFFLQIQFIKNTLARGVRASRYEKASYEENLKNSVRTKVKSLLDLANDLN